MLEKRNLLVQEALSAGLAVSGLGKSTHLTMPPPLLLWVWAVFPTHLPRGCPQRQAGPGSSALTLTVWGATQPPGSLLSVPTAPWDYESLDHAATA